MERFGSGSWDKKRKMGGRRHGKRGALAGDLGKSPDAEQRGREGRNSKGILRSVAVPEEVGPPERPWEGQRRVGNTWL